MEDNDDWADLPAVKVVAINESVLADLSDEDDAWMSEMSFAESSTFSEDNRLEICIF
jgi:hypothetical protein